MARLEAIKCLLLSQNTRLEGSFNDLLGIVRTSLTNYFRAISDYGADERSWRVYCMLYI